MQAEAGIPLRNSRNVADKRLAKVPGYPVSKDPGQAVPRRLDHLAGQESRLTVAFLRNRMSQELIAQLIEFMPDTLQAVHILKNNRGDTLTGQIEYMLRTHPDMQTLAKRRGIEWQQRRGRGQKTARNA